MTPGESVEKMRTLATWLANALKDHREQAIEYANAAHAYRLAAGAAYFQFDGSQGDKRAHAEQMTSGERLRMELADGRRQNALEQIRSARQEISALQSLLAAYKEEAAFSRTGPQETP